jgi:NSS family neurotransmitter:Na+ symporter
MPVDAAATLPPATGFSLTSFLIQRVCTTIVILACAAVLLKGLRAGIERASKVIMPALLVIILVLMFRSLSLDGAMEGVRWYVLKFRLQDIDAKVVVAALGHAMFSLSLGGTFMVLYGSYLQPTENVARPAIWTVAGDTGSALLAGFAVIPAVFALGLEPTSGPALLFDTLPKVFAAIPAGWIFGFLFFFGLCAAGYLSDVPAFEALVAGLTDNTKITRTKAIWLVSAAVFVLSIPPSINMAIFGPWDLTFGSGMQTLGALLAVVTLGWCVNRSAALAQLSAEGARPVPMWLYYWIRFGIPAAILSVGVWWFVTDVLGKATAA